MRRAALLLAGLVAAAPLAAAPPPEPNRKSVPAAQAASRQAVTATDRKIDLAYGAYQRGLYLTAYREATARLDRDPGDTAAMTLIGELYNQGLLVRQDAKAAASWYRLAAERGEPHAMATLGLMALDGRGTARDPAMAREWLEKASALREPTAAYNLALTLLASGSEPEIARAAALLVIAAEAEIADAQHALGVLHARGQGGVARDPAEAARLYLRAARNGSLAGEVEFAIAQFNGDGMPRDEAGAFRHFRLAASRGNAIAQNRLARLYATGRGVAKNLVEAAAWNLAATAQGLLDPWLDQQVRELSDVERNRAEFLAAERSGRA